MLERIFFIIVTLITIYLAFKYYKKVFLAINLGKGAFPSDHKKARRLQMLRIAFGQKKMFKRWIPGVLHFFIYTAFLFTQIELLEMIIDGVAGTHRILRQLLGPIYLLVVGSIEVLSVLALIGTSIFLIRRNILNLSRFHKPEMKGWPFRDANLILLGEILLISGLFMMNGSEVILDAEAPFFPFSTYFGPICFAGLSDGTLHILHSAGWWLHMLVVYGFILYLPFSKHLHILFAFPNTYYAPLAPASEMENMPEIADEVKSMLGLIEDSGEMSEDIPEFGVKDIFDLPKTTLLAAYTCTECGRCTDQCPANITGKKLSPRKIMMDIRDRADQVATNILHGQYLHDQEESKPLSQRYDDGKSLHDFISAEEIFACTTCMACVEACPVLIRPLQPILELRRYHILTLAAGPNDWLPMFTSLENNGAVWQMSESRLAWTQD